MNLGHIKYRRVSILLLFVLCTYSSAASKQVDSSRADVEIRSSAVPAKIRRRVQPVYPPEAKKGHIEGRVVVRVLGGKDGKVKLLRVEEGHPLLARAANDAIRQWEFEPLVLIGEPVEFEATIEVIFTLMPDAKAPRPPGPPAAEPSAIPDLTILESKANPRTSQTAAIVQPGKLRKKVLPEISKGMGVKPRGPVTLRFRITKEGNVADVEGLRGDPVLLKACAEAVRRWEYEPTLVDGQPVEVETTLTLNVDWHYRIH